MDDQLLVIQNYIDTNKQATDELRKDCDDLKKKLNKHYSEFSNIKTFINKVLGNNQNSLTDNMDSHKSQDPTAVILDKNKSPPLEDGNSTKIGGMWTLKHDISSPKLFELLIKT